MTRTGWWKWYAEVEVLSEGHTRTGKLLILEEVSDDEFN